MKKLTEIYKSVITEKSLSRVWQHIRNGDTFAVISAFRGTNADEQNLQLHRQLKSDISSMGLGFIEQKSGYTYDNPDTGEEGQVQEMSLFIPKMTLDQAMKIGKKYNQESIIYKDNERFDLVDVNGGNVIMQFSKGSDKRNDFENRPLTFNPDVLKYAYSEFNKSRNANAKKPYAFKVAEVFELRIPSRTDSMRAISTGKLAESTWLKIL
jgi:hypothetical protein